LGEKGVRAIGRFGGWTGIGAGIRTGAGTGAGAGIYFKIESMSNILNFKK
jgi:hypothetical protein